MAPFLTKYGHNMAKNEYFQKSLDHFVETTDPQSNFEHILTFFAGVIQMLVFFSKSQFSKIIVIF